jgi:uncharacterized protein YkvS
MAEATVADGGAEVIKTAVSVGIGHLRASAVVNLIACPHVGDTIEVKGVTVTCDRVHITENSVYVEETYRFASEQEAREYFK